MSSLSLNASLRTCKVQTGYAANAESDRFLNPGNMVCVPWNGMNLKGQTVHADSRNTKSAGCNSALDRVSVESHLRPDYSAYIGLNMAGLQGEMYDGNQTAYDNTHNARDWELGRRKVTGNYGSQFQASNVGSCTMHSYDKAMADIDKNKRHNGFANNSYDQNAYASLAGTCS